MTPESSARFRDQYRQQQIPPRYCVWCHIAFTFGGGSLAVLLILWQLQAVQPLEWLVLPIALLYANLAEYFGHRYPMHHPFPGLGLIYKRHAGQHHRFFSQRQMPIDSLRDLRAVLFPPTLVLFFFGGFGLPLWFALDWLISANAAWLALAAGVAYYLNYELFHLAYHLPEQHPLARLGLIRRLRWLHARHHDPAVMTRVNFNISYPLGDWLFGTLSRGEAGSAAAGLKASGEDSAAP